VFGASEALRQNHMGCHRVLPRAPGAHEGFGFRIGRDQSILEEIKSAVSRSQCAQLLAPDAVIKQRRKHRLIAQAFHRVIRRSIEQLAGLGVAERERGRPG